MNHYIFAGLEQTEKTKFRFENLIDVPTDEIITRYCQNMSLRVDNVLGKCRKRYYAHARFILYNRLRKTNTLKYIGDIFGRDHTTIIYGLQQYEDLKKTDPEFRMLIKSAEQGTSHPYGEPQKKMYYKIKPLEECRGVIGKNTTNPYLNSSIYK